MDDFAEAPFFIKTGTVSDNVKTERRKELQPT